VSAFEPTGKRDAWKAGVPPGASVTVEILSIDLERKRIGVAVIEAGEEREVPEHAEQQDPAQAEGFGSLADKLRAALRPPDK